MAQAASDKIVTLEDLADRLRALRQAGRPGRPVPRLLRPPARRSRQASAGGKGDGRRAGRVRDARRHVAKGTGRPVFGEAPRAEALATLARVDFVAIDRGPTAAEAIRLLRPRYFVKGQEFEDRTQPRPRLEAEISDRPRGRGGDRGVRLRAAAAEREATLVRATGRPHHHEAAVSAGAPGRQDVRDGRAEITARCERRAYRRWRLHLELGGALRAAQTQQRKEGRRSYAHVVAWPAVSDGSAACGRPDAR